MSLPFLPRSLVTTTLGAEFEVEDAEAEVLRDGEKNRRWSCRHEEEEESEGAREKGETGGAIGDVLDWEARPQLPAVTYLTLIAFIYIYLFIIASAKVSNPRAKTNHNLTRRRP
jgi:hypothetical protein